jgi:sulfide dehydrogenase cytochrome subunit
MLGSCLRVVQCNSPEEKTMHRGVMFALAAASFMAAGISVAAGNIEGLARTCNNCHGVNGVSAGGSMPSIAGLPEAYLKNIMTEWKTGKRASANMTRLISGYTDEEIAGLAQYFAKLPWVPVAQKTDPKLVERGKQASQGCAGCHGPTGKAVLPGTPNLNGQLAKYIELELLKYKDEAFAMPSAMMRMAVKSIKDEDIPAIAEFYASQK